MTILDEIIEAKKKLIPSLPHIDRTSVNFKRKPHSLKKVLEENDFSIIFEYKRKTPSSGHLNDINIVEQIGSYIKHGSKVVSVLTDTPFFGGTFDDLATARDNFPHLVLLNKDFIIHTKQIDMAKENGADVILLIAMVLDSYTLINLYDYAYSLGLDVIVECHDEADIEKANLFQPEIVGINNRNLKDFSVDIFTCERLQKDLNYKPLFISESGIHTAEDLQTVKSFSNAALIGTAFMKGDLINAV